MLTEDEIRDYFMNQIACGSVVAMQFEAETGKSKSELMRACGGFGGGLFLFIPAETADKTVG